MPGKPSKSCVVVAKALDSEGFTPTVSKLVRKYWLRNIVEGRKMWKVTKTIRAFREQVTPKLTQGDRFVLGKFIGMREKMAFDTGLRIGLQAFLSANDGATQQMFADLEKRNQETERQLQVALRKIQEDNIPSAEKVHVNTAPRQHADR